MRHWHVGKDLPVVESTQTHKIYLAETKKKPSNAEKMPNKCVNYSEKIILVFFWQLTTISIFLSEYIK